MGTWANDIVKALNKLGGEAHYDHIYSEVSNIREITTTYWKQTIQKTIQSKSSDSEGYAGGEDLFYSVNGLHAGVWGLRQQYTQEEKKEIARLLMNPEPLTYEEIIKDFETKVNLSIKDTQNSRENRLKKANTIPEKTTTKITIYSRNPDVVAATLLRANGVCEKCKKPAPFIRAKDNTPFLEVHHIVQLAHNGEDTLKNTLALCPNCHKELHYG